MTRAFFTTSAIILLMVFLIPLHVIGVTDSSHDKLLAEGKTLLDLGQTEEARAIFQRVLIEDPQNAEALSYLQKAGASEQPPANRQPSTVNRQLSFPVNRQPSSPSPLELEEEPEPFKGHKDMVVPKPFDEQVSGEPQEEQVESYDGSALELEEEGATPTADRQPSSADRQPSTVNRQLSYEEQVEPDVPRSPRRRLHYYYRRGLEAYEAKNYAEAIKAFEEAQKIRTNYRRADYYRREAWNKLADREWAREQAEEAALEQVMEKESYDAYGRGKEYMRYGKYEAAIKECQKVLDREPDHRGAKALMEKARLKLEKTAFEDEVAAAELLAREEEELRMLTEGEEEMAVREAYYEAEQLYRKKEFESSRRKFAEVQKKRKHYRRAGFYMRRIDKELWEKKEQEIVDFEAEAIRKYTLGPEDVVRVVIRNHPEFDFAAPVEESGELIIPLTNEIIQAAGLTREELAEEIRQYLTAYIDNPFVSVFITGYNSKKYYVLQPESGGSEFIMDKASMTLWEVMFRAGIPELDKAALRRIQVITPHKTHPTHRWINVYAMLYEGKMEDNIRIEPGTIIYYPMLAVLKFDQIIKTITKPISSITSLTSSYEEWDTFRKDYLR